MPSPFRADIGFICIFPPQSSGVKSLLAKSPLTFSISAPSKSTLFIATTIETPAALAWLIASSVCGLIPSFAATTKTTISVVFAPLARIDEKAAWPGVSIKVSLPFEVSTSYAPICCVIPPASPSTTFVFLIKSNKVVLPWSTWPMTVITAGLDLASSSYWIKLAISSSKFSFLIAIPLCPISSTTKIAVSWSIKSLMFATTPKLIKFFTTSPPFTAMDLARSPTWIVSGISISFFINSFGASNWCFESSKFTSFFL